MKNITLFIFINFICLGYANSQTLFQGGSDNIEVTGNIKAQSNHSNSSESVKSSAKKIVPIVLVDKGVWVADKNIKISQTGVKKNTDSLISSNYSRGNFAGFTTGDETIDAYILDSAARHNVDPLLIYAQMYQESGFRLRATSYKGARGLMQLMPGTALRFGVKNIYDPKQNIDGGIKYMRWLMDKFDGDERLALAGYNAGEGAVMKYGNQIPPYEETRQYVKKIIAHYNSIKSRKPAKL